MSEQSLRLLYLLAVGTCLFVIMFGIKGRAVIINLILLAVIITIAALPLPNDLKRQGVPGRMSLLSYHC